MNIKFLGVMTVTLQLTTSAYGINYKRLGLEADTYQQRIWSQVPSDAEMVKKSLSFLSKEDTIDPKYTKSENFHKFYEQATSEIKDERFLGFSTICKTLFETSNDDLQRASVYMLFEKVREKSVEYLRLLQKAEEFKRKQRTPVSGGDESGSLDYFLKFDTIKTK